MNNNVQLKLGFVSVIRPAFKGDSRGAAARSLAKLHKLGDEFGFEVISASGAASDLESSRQAARELSSTGLDYLLIQHTTFATGELLVPLLHAAPRVGVWALPEAAGRAEAVGPLPFNALCGLNMTLSFLEHPWVAKREPVKWFYGEADSAWFKARLAPTVAALRGLKALEAARVLQVGGTAPAFYGLEERPELASVRVDNMELAEVFERMAALPEAQVKDRALEWAKEEPLEAPLEHLERAVRLELVLKAIAAEDRYDAIALRCWPEFPERCGAQICAAVGRMADAEIPTACEGDVMGALSMLVLQGVGGQPSVLLDLSDVDMRDDTLLFWHCGNGPLAWAARPGTRLTKHFNRDTMGVVRDMVLHPGPATGFRLLSGGKRALIVSGKFLEAKSSFDGVRGWLGNLTWSGEAVGAQRFVANVLDAHLPHHFAFGLGQSEDALTELCAYLGADPLPARPLRHTL